MTSATDVDSATSVALSLARSIGLRPSTAAVLHAGANLTIRLEPLEVVARVVAEVGRWRVDGGFPDATRELAVARAASVRGAPVVVPLDPPLGGPHRAEGLIVSFWQHVPVITADHGFDDPVRTGRALRELHDALADAAGELALPPLPVWQDTVTWIRRAPLLGDADRSWLLTVHERLADDLASLRLPMQPVHGDAHPGNALVTDRGVLWTDFEETGSWPVEWDLACILSGSLFGRDVAVRRTIVRTFGRDPDDPLLEPFLAARVLMASAWMAVTGEYRGVPIADRLTEQLAWLRKRHPPR